MMNRVVNLNVCNTTYSYSDIAAHPNKLVTAKLFTHLCGNFPGNPSPIKCEQPSWVVSYPLLKTWLQQWAHS